MLFSSLRETNLLLLGLLCLLFGSVPRGPILFDEFVWDALDFHVNRCRGTGIVAKFLRPHKKYPRPCDFFPQRLSLGIRGVTWSVNVVFVGITNAPVAVANPVMMPALDQRSVRATSASVIRVST